MASGEHARRAPQARMKEFLAELPVRGRRVLERLGTPLAVQWFLDSIPYSTDPMYRSPRRVLADRKAHCFDGGLFAAAALRRLGHAPLIVDLCAERDDDHLLAVFRGGGRWGAVAKSNFVGLRYREPVYASLRELVMSYFDVYFNATREKTLRAYVGPLDLSKLDRLNWMANDEHLEEIVRRLDRMRRVRLLTARAARALSPIDLRSYRAGMLGIDRAGLYKL